MATQTRDSNSEENQDPKRVAEKEQWRDDLRVLLRCLRDSRSPWYASALMLGVLAWGVIPVDPLPDMIPLAGIVDDATVFLIIRSAVYRLIPNEVVDFHANVVEEKSRLRFGPARAVGSVAIIQIIIIVAFLGGIGTIIA